MDLAIDEVPIVSSSPRLTEKKTVRIFLPMRGGISKNLADNSRSFRRILMKFCDIYTMVLPAKPVNL